MSRFTGKYDIASWEFTKTLKVIEDDVEENLYGACSIFIHQTIAILHIFESYKLLMDLEIKQSGIDDTVFRNIDWKNPKVWLTELGLFSLNHYRSFFIINGLTEVLNKKNNTNLRDIIQIFLHLSYSKTKKEFYFSFSIKLKSDHWFSYSIIDKFEYNPDYVDNARRLRQALNEINLLDDYEVEQGEYKVVTINGFNLYPIVDCLHEHEPFIDLYNEHSTYTVGADLKSWFAHFPKSD